MNLTFYQIQTYTKEAAFPNNFKFTDVFNDTMVHSFPEFTLHNLPDAFWEFTSEPQYSDDSEFIPNK